MGCDIHIVLERRVDGAWLGLSAFHSVTTHKRRDDGLGFAFPVATSRNYHRFAALAGVRGDGPAPRGAPDDISGLARFEIGRWGDDGHSHSWLPLKDAARIFLETTNYDGSVNFESYEAKYPECYFFGVEDDDLDAYRLVFWFDN